MTGTPDNPHAPAPEPGERLLRVEESQAFSEHAIDELRRQIEQLNRRFDELARRIISLDAALRKKAEEPSEGQDAGE